MFTNTALFSLEAKKFEKEGSYCRDPINSPAWIDYWETQLKYCQEGYSVGGTRITGNYYFYLNFCQIKLTDDDDDKKEKVNRVKKVTFPNFWDGDYEYFHIIDKAIEQGKHLCVGKARRRGFSYKNSAICANKYNTVRNSITLIGAFDKKYLYPEGTMTMSNEYLSFLNENTGWFKKRLIDKQYHKKAGYTIDKNGTTVEKGYKSQILAISFKDNPGAALGKDGTLILFEEAGKFPNLKASYLATKETVQDGIYTTGLILIFGTGGDDAGATSDFYELFYNPEPYNIMSFENIWDENEQNNRCSYFVPDYKNKVGFMDDDGNSNEAKAKEYEEAVRQHISKTSKDKKTLTRHITQHPFNGREAFFLSTNNIFPVVDLKHRLGYLEANQMIRNADYIGNLIIEEDGKVKWKEDTKLLPITDFPLKAGDQTDGCIVIFNHPYTDDRGMIPDGMYLAGIDPYDHDKAQTGSLGSTIIYDKVNKKIVAEYSARPETAKIYYENVRRMLMYYNCRALYENERKGIFDYFDSKNCLYLLADEPEIIKDIIHDSRVHRGKGMHMTKGLKDYGETLINQWLIEPREDKSLNLHKIRSMPILKELISYNDTGNFDRVSAFICVLYYEADMRKQKISESTEIKGVLDDPFFKRDLFKKRKQDITYSQQPIFNQQPAFSNIS